MAIAIDQLQNYYTAGPSDEGPIDPITVLEYPCINLQTDRASSNYVAEKGPLRPKRPSISGFVLSSVSTGVMPYILLLRRKEAQEGLRCAAADLQDRIAQRWLMQIQKALGV